jgi:hypothetical protein
LAHGFLDQAYEALPILPLRMRAGNNGADPIFLSS